MKILAVFDQHTSVSWPTTKLTTALGAGLGSKVVEQHAHEAQRFVLETWADLAALAAFTYSITLLLEFLWRKCGRPLAEKHGWIQPQKRRKEDDA